MKHGNKTHPEHQPKISQKVSQERLDLLLRVGSDCICDHNLETNELYLSESFFAQYGWKSNSPDKNKAHFDAHVHPEDRRRIEEELNAALTGQKTEMLIRNYRLLKADKHYAFVEEKLIFLKDAKQKVTRVLGLIRDVSNELFHEQMDALGKDVMELSMLPEAGVEFVISHYLKGLEHLFPGMKTSVLWVKNDCLYNLSSPSLHPEYIAAIEGQKIGPNRGSCGTAAFLKEKVIVNDVFSDERWASFRGLALKYQIGACWSQPIFTNKGEVIATFALYYHEPRNPDVREEQAIDRSRSLLSVLLSNYLYVQNILDSNARHTYINKATNDAIYDWDMRSNQIVWGESFVRLFGYPEELPFMSTPKVWEKILYTQDFTFYRNTFFEFLQDKNRVKWEAEYRVVRYNGTISYIKEIAYLVRNEAGEAIRMIGVLRDVSESIYSNQITRIQSELSGCFKGNRLLNQVMEDALEKLTQFGAFHTAEIWLTSLDGKHINLTSKYAKDELSKKYFELSKTLKKLKLGEGIPGLVWQNRQTVLFNDIQSNPAFVRKEAVKAAQLKAAYGMPLMHGADFVGVLMFCCRETVSENLTELEVLRNIGEFLGAEIKRKQQEEEMLLLFESAPEMMAIVSPEGYFTKVNPAFCKVLGYSEEEITFQPFGNFLHPEDLTNTLTEYEETITGERHAENFVNRYITKTGESKWISWSSSDVFGEDGFVFAYGRDITEMKEMEKLLEAASTFSRVGGWEMSLIKPETESLTWSDMTRQIFEVDYTYKPCIANTIDFFVGLDKQTMLNAMQGLRNSGQSFDLKLLIRTAKGNERWIRVIGKSDFFNGTCTRIFGSIQDIHHQKLLEIELQRSLVEKTDILESIGDAFYRVDHNFVVNYWNKQAEILLQMPRSYILGKNIWEVYPNAVDTGFYRNFQLAIQEQKNVHFEEFHADSQRWLEVSAYPSETGLSIYFKDVTQRVLSQEAIYRSNERFEKVTEATNDAIWDWDLETGSLYWGQGFKKLFGFDLSQFEPTLKAWEEHLHPVDKDRVMDLLNNALAEPKVTSIQLEYRYRKADGNYAFVTDRSIIIRDSKGKPIRMLGAMSDITENMEYQRSLLELNQRLEMHTKELAISNKELEQFAYVASHDLQEPLRMVSSFLTQLEKRYGNALDDRAHQYIHFAVDGAKRMRQIILDLLDFSRVGKNDGELEWISFNDIVEEVKALQRKLIEEKHAQIVVSNLPQIKAFKGPILQVMQNVIGNALKYSKEEEAPIIHIQSKNLDGFVEVSIQDNGIGIEPEYFDKIFIIFQRLHNAERYSGTGMGLAIVKKIMENLGGSIRLESEPGKGSVFYLVFPQSNV